MHLIRFAFRMMTLRSNRARPTFQVPQLNPKLLAAHVVELPVDHEQVNALRITWTGNQGAMKTSKYNNKTRLIKKMKRPFFFIQVVSA